MKLKYLLIIILLLLTLSTITSAASDTGKPHVIVIVLNHLELKDFDNLPLNGFSIGLMNASVAGAHGVESGCLTIGAGSRASGNFQGRYLMNAEEESQEGNAGKIFQRLTGIKAPAGSVVNLGINSLLRDNQSKKDSIIPGALGMQLHKSGLKTGVIGCYDGVDRINRSAALIAMDDRGIIDFGDVSTNTLIRDDSSPLGYRANYDYIYKKFKETYTKTNLIVVSPGDLERIERSRDDSSDEAIQQDRELALIYASSLIKKIIKTIDKSKDTIIVVSPVPYSGHGIWNKLAPVAVKFTGNLPYTPGITTATTHTEGLVTNLDIAPTILNLAGAEQFSASLGHNIYAHKRLNIGELKKYDKLVTLNYDSMFPIMLSGGILALCALVFGFLWLAFPKVMPGWMKFLAKLSIFCLGAYPVVCLLLTLVPQNGILERYTVFAAMLLIPSIIPALSGLSGRSVLVWLSIISFAALFIDVLFGCNLISKSIICAYPLSGFRYYGMGNEYMGVMIANAFVILTLGVKKNFGDLPKKYYSMILLLIAVIAILIGYPGLGANVGGVITAIPGLGALYLVMSGKKVNVRNIIFTGVFSVIAIGIFFLTDIFLNTNNPSHMAQTAVNFRSEGTQYIFDMIIRKLMLNVKLIDMNESKNIMLITFIVLALAYWRLGRIISDTMKRNLNVSKAFPAALTAVFCALVFNDSGIVPAAIITASYVMAVLVLIFDGSDRINGDG